MQQIATGSEFYQVTGEGYSPLGKFQTQGHLTSPVDHPELANVLLACVLCNDATLQQQDHGWTVLGDPTEGALLAVAGKGGLYKEALTDAYRRVGEVPFTSERKRMSVVCSTDHAHQPLIASPYLMLTKGSPELVLEQCDQIYLDHSSQPLTQEQRDQILATNNRMAEGGLRVLGFGFKPLTNCPEEAALESAETNLIWLGLVSMLDAPRPEVATAVAACREAGIRPVMITGDHPLTARAIAEKLGITSAGSAILSGQELEHLNQTELQEQVSQVNVYARVAPEHKLRIVKALQKRGEFVAMTGDGVNDAPALKQADIGIAMGITGTDVSKEASDMVLLDDNFATIVAATEEGRVVYDNIRRFIKYILGSNIGEVITIAAAPLLGLGECP